MALFCLLDLLAETRGLDLTAFKAVAFPHLLLALAPDFAQVLLDLQSPLAPRQLIDLLLCQECRDLNLFDITFLTWVLVIDVEPKLAHNPGQRVAIRRAQGHAKDV